jgi:hypothetical protein
MSLWDLVGYVAAALVVAAFCMREMVALRMAALCSNLAFIAYGLALGLTPVWLLHALLLPMNGYRLLEVLRARRISVSRKIEVVRLGPANGSTAGRISLQTMGAPSSLGTGNSRRSGKMSA